MSVRLSPKYGVNPTIATCFFCGEEKNEIALLGKIGGRGKDIEAPRSCVVDYEPCEKCKANMALGTTLLGVTDIQPSDNRPAIDKKQGLYPTGRWSVIKTEAVGRIFGAQYEGLSKILVEDGVLDWLEEQRRMVEND